MQIRLIPARTTFVALAMLAVAVLGALLAGVSVRFASRAAAVVALLLRDCCRGGLPGVSQRLASRIADPDTALPPAFAIAVKRPLTVAIETHGAATDGWRGQIYDHVDSSLHTEGLPAAADAGRRNPARTDVSRDANFARGSGVRAGRRTRALATGLLRDARADRRARAAPRLPGLCPDRALRLAGRRPPAAGDWRQDLPAARRGHRLQAAVGVSRRRFRAPHRLAGDPAPRQAHRPSVPGRARSMRDAPHRLRPPHARRRPAGKRSERRTSIKC